MRACGAIVRRDRLPERRHRLLGSAQVQQRAAKLQERGPVLGLDRERLAEPIGRLLRPPCGAERMTEVVADVGAVRIERGGAAVVRDGLVVAAEAPERAA